MADIRGKNMTSHTRKAIAYRKEGGGEGEEGRAARARASQGSLKPALPFALGPGKPRLASSTMSSRTPRSGTTRW